MYSRTLALVLAFWILNLALLVDAGVYVLKPSAGSKCHGGQTCTIEWLDDGVQPLLSAAGVCTFGLYTGKQTLVQAITPADVSTVRSVTFKPNPAAGPNSDAYYIGIISTKFRDNSSTPYMAFSPFFSIDRMTGSLDNPLPGATSSIPILPSLTHSATGSGTATSRSTTVLSTITVGTLSTSLPRLPTPVNTKPAATKSGSSSSAPSVSASPSSTRLSTSLLSSTTLTGTRTGAPTPLSNGVPRHGPPIPALAAVALFLSPLLLSLF